MNAAEIPGHLCNASETELKDMLEAGFIEPCNHPTAWCSRSFFVQKPGVGPTKVRMVSDFRPVNRILRRPGYPYEGSTQILKRLNPEEPFFSTIDLSSGYHQLTLHEDDRDLFAIILPQGKFRYRVLPQGISPASDLFNIMTDEDIRNKPGFFKNMDDVLTTGKDIHQL